MRQTTKDVIFRLATAFVLLIAPRVASAQVGVATHTGALPDGATYLIEFPANWNGTMFLYSHGYVVPGTANPAQDVGDPATRFFMLSNGFALAGSSYASTGWPIEQALPDQIAVFDIFTETVGPPKQTVAWGHSLGGMITAGLVQRYPDRFDAARISADREATEYLEKNIIYNGEIHIPALTLHTTGDGLVVVENESAHGQVVREEGNEAFLRRTFVAGTGHCVFTPAETIAAVLTLLGRLASGNWGQVHATALNAAAASLGPFFSIFTNSLGAVVLVAPAFVDFKPGPYLRPFASESEECESGRRCRE